MTVCASKITGSGFKHLGGMKQLESINLHSSPASDAGLEAIGKLTSLRRLEIVHTNVTDAGLAHLAGLVNLRQLHIHGHDTTRSRTAITSENFKNCYELDIYGPPASNRTLAEISQLPKLRMLRFFNAPLDDDGVKHLGRANHARRVNAQFQQSDRCRDRVPCRLEKTAHDQSGGNKDLRRRQETLEGTAAQG